MKITTKRFLVLVFCIFLLHIGFKTISYAYTEYKTGHILNHYPTNEEWFHGSVDSVYFLNEKQHVIVNHIDFEVPAYTFEKKDGVLYYPGNLKLIKHDGRVITK